MRSPRSCAWATALCVLLVGCGTKHDVPTLFLGDSDGDGIPDYAEVAFGSDPRDPDDPFVGGSAGRYRCEPVLVSAQRRSSAGADTFEMLVPATNRFVSGYTIQAAEGYTSFMNIVVPEGFGERIVLDGSSLGDLGITFSTVPGTALEGALVPVTGGSHTLRGPQPFCVNVFGYVPAIGYGYTGNQQIPHR